MRQALRCSVGLLVYATVLVRAWASPVLAPLFSDYVVLQRDMNVPVWGTARPGEKILVRYQHTQAETITGDDGRWRLSLPPMTACAGADLIVSGETVVIVKNVAVGDVWLLAGQSNMEWPLAKSDGANEAAKTANWPWLRHIKIPHRVSDRNESDFQARWVPCSSVTSPDFSAVGFFFTKHLYSDGKVPVGLLNVSYGGTKIEGWMGPGALDRALNGPKLRQRWQDVLAQLPAAQAKHHQALSDWEQEKARAGASGQKSNVPMPRAPVGPGDPTQLSGLHHGMVAPVQPFGIKGVIWYQGESNVDRADEYPDLLTAMIRDWREGFGQAELPFFIVQLPNYADPRYDWWRLRDAQAHVTREVSGAYLAVTIDLGESRDKHPRNKDEVGRRLALLARRHVFSESVAAAAPEVNSAIRRGGEVLVGFADVTIPLTLRPTSRTAITFELAGRDGVFHSASSRLEGLHVVLQSAAVSEPTAVRYLKHNDPLPVLFTSEGLPVAPFQAAVEMPKLGS